MQFWQAVQSFFQSVWDTMVGVVKSFGLNDLLDILLVTFLIYKAIQIIRETRAAQLIKGILLLCVDKPVPMTVFPARHRRGDAGRSAQCDEIKNQVIGPGL